MLKYAVNQRNLFENKGRDKNMAIVIDGIIGAGKTTVGEFISRELGIPLFQELKDDGKESRAQRMLDLFYETPDRWSAIIQVMFLNDRFKDLKRIERDGNSAVLDRSIYGDEIFARTIHERGEMTHDEFEIYRDLLHNMLAHIKVPEILIYIDVSVDVAMNRIRKRARSTEGDTIPRDYMEDLKRNYESWYNAYNISPKVRINFDKDAVDSNGNLSSEVAHEILQAIRPYVNL
ncbi:deoxynucleoside kinase [Fusibacter tunisiensis]|uniref:Deoxyadenosine/deoxycytidine kinase n=1 Tax=Fusibacter tunisiensis TaxID=1008308 RepID=A0ABS2MTE4_9FIRM|nr:deoxynucleoside kinase [Fusibacter tunisiensis]MBM7562665.1 deoxyadenosine/deoxycytidine kinase [Fusibacter tunisiensis]